MGKGINKECKGFQELFELMALHAGTGYNTAYYINYDLGIDKERLLVEGIEHNFFLWCIRRNGTHLFNLENKEERNSKLIEALKEDKDNRFFEIKKLGRSWFLTPHQVNLAQNDCQKCYYWLDNNPSRVCYDCRDRNNFKACTCCIKCDSSYTIETFYSDRYICESCDWENFERLADYLTEGECEFTHQFMDYKIVYEDGEYHLYTKHNDCSVYYFMDVSEIQPFELNELIKAFDYEYPAALNFYRLKCNNE